MVRTSAAGEKSRFVGAHVSGIEGLSAAASRELVSRLVSFATQPRFLYTHSWRPRDLLIWDNRCVIHRGRPFPSGLRRHLVRATVAGDAPTVLQ
jgi:alpha-ketoglutarate-dependent 2,4-dichlorophenoxyacetate dioxygenase